MDDYQFHRLLITLTACVKRGSVKKARIAGAEPWYHYIKNGNRAYWQDVENGKTDWSSDWDDYE
jgi:hypothetical protein